MKSLIKFTSLCGVIGLLLSVSVSLSSAQPDTDSNVVRVEIYASHDRIHPGESFQAAIVATIRKGFHINSHTPADKSLMPTVVKLDDRKDIVFSPVRYPKPWLKSFSFSADKLSVYEGRIVILAQGKLSEDISFGDVKISGFLAYHACNDQSCFMPRSVKFEIPLEVVRAGAPIKLINKDIFQERTSFTSDELRAKELIERGLPYALFAFFLFGLALNLTPCVYPVIPMTVGFFAGQGEGKKRDMFVLASFYVVGIAFIFSMLGLVSGVAGKQWGFLFQHPWFVIFIVIIILSMAASMFGAFEITIPSYLMTKLGKARQGAIGSFTMGLTVGVVIAPCAAGIVIGLVGVVAKLGIAARGALLFFVMGLGLGLPYLFLATFSGLLRRLPKSGMWMLWVRKLLGILLIGVALYFLIPQARQVTDQQDLYLGVLAIFGGLLLGFLEHSEGYSRGFKIVRAFLGCLLILAGLFLVERALHPKAASIHWVHSENQSIEQLKNKNRPIMIDFYAAWCGACKELDRKTFAKKQVVEKSSEFIMVKVDCTSPDGRCTELAEKFRVWGLPTVVFISAEGEELNSLRVVGFLGPDEMLRRMERASAK